MPLIDPDLPPSCFVCHSCGTAIPDPEKAAVEPLAKGGGFSSMKIFCTQICADSTIVEAALVHMDDDAPATDVNGDVIYPADATLDQARDAAITQALLDELYTEFIDEEDSTPLEKTELEKCVRDPSMWSAWNKGVSVCNEYNLEATLDLSTGIVSIESQ